MPANEAIKESDICPKCRKPWTEVQKTYHHVLVKRFFPGSHLKIPLCRKDHDELEKRIPLKQKMPRSFYFLVVNNFMGFGLVFDNEQNYK